MMQAIAQGGYICVHCPSSRFNQEFGSLGFFERFRQCFDDNVDVTPLWVDDADAHVPNAKIFVYEDS